MADTPEQRSTSNILPDIVAPGDIIRASDFNAVLETLRNQSRIWSEAGPTNIATRPGMIRGLNNSGGDIVEFQLVEITGATLYVPPVINFDIPSAAQLSLIAITAQPIADTRVGWLYVYGECLVQYVGVVVIGDRLGTQNGLTTAIEDGVSSLVVIGTTIIGAVNYALVRFSPAPIGTYVAPDTVGTTAETDAAQVDTWDITAPPVGTDGVTITELTRFAYNHAGDQKLYAYYRDKTYDSVGNLVSISVETRVTIDTPDSG